MNIKSSYPNITEQDIATFERTFEVALPMAYRGFLLEHNGGVPANMFFVKDGAEVVVNEFLPLRNGNLSVEGYLEDFHFNLQHLIPIAEDAFGNLILIDCNSEKGVIHFWNHETTTVTYVTNSFEYFIENLQEQVD